MKIQVRMFAIFVLFFFVRIAATDVPNPLGFFPDSVQNEAKYEAIFLKTPSPDNARKLLRWLTEEPHAAGTPAEQKTAEFVRDKLKEFGFDAQIAPYEVYLNYPKSASLKLVVPHEEELSLREAGLDRDKDSYSVDALPSFHGYGASGKTSGQVVYVNYGTREDFDKLQELGLSAAGKIAIVRYGKVFRGLKVREAQDRGATGILIYSDPADDGYMKGDVYPDGPMRPESGIQRGSVQFISEAAGDPTTPGWASVKGAKHLEASKSAIPKIPSLPISYGEARKILSAMGGPRVPDEWQGGLPFAYHVGPGGAEVAMNVEMDYAIRPIWDVIARIPGSIENDRWVILGNHRDAWTYGAVDPNSGTVALLETARALSAAWKAGWRPRRTIVLASWDAEEYGLLGSTEWGEDHQAELSEKAVAYINLDSAVPAGDLSVNGIPSLRDLMIQVAAAVPEPRAGGSVLDAWSKKLKNDWATTEPVDLQKPDQPFYLNLEALGSGSDYTVFVDHLGVASISYGFDGPYGVYHSIYDNFFWMEHFGDPEFLYHIAAAQLYGLLAMRLAGPEVVPMRYTPYAEHLKEDLDVIRRNNIIELRKYSPDKKKQPLNPDFSPIVKTLDEFSNAAAGLDSALEKTLSARQSASLLRLNDSVVKIEREFLDSEGLPKRSWFRHVLFAPGFTTGYGSWPLPGITQALKDRDAAMFDAEMKKLILHLQSATQKMKEAATLTSQL